MSTFGVRGRVAALAVVGFLCAPLFAVADTAAPKAKPYLGVAVEPGESGQTGLIVSRLDPASPAGKAGLKDGDRILMVGDKALKSFDDLRDAVAGHKSGDKIALKIMRDGKEQTVTVTLGQAPMRETRNFEPAEKPGAFLGVLSQPLSKEIKEHLKLNVDKGALVARIQPGSPAAKAGLQELDVITKLGDTAVNGPQDLRNAVEQTGAGKEVTLKVIRGDKTMDVKAQLAAETANAMPGREGWMPEMPEGFGRFQNRTPLSFFPNQEKVDALEKKVKELENRIDQLERNQAKPGSR
jgi:predicted metalloprotease with PDZ domain